MAVFIKDAAMVRFGKRKEALAELMCYSARKILESMGRGEEIDALYIGTMNPEEMTGDGNYAALIADNLGLTDISATRIENAPGSGSAAFEAACMSVLSGVHENVLVIAGEKMTGSSTERTTKAISKLTTPYERKYGISMAAMTALMARRYMHDFGLGEEELAEIPVKSHKNGALNPFAHFQKEITVEDVLKSRMVADPFRVYHCSPISDGACAVLLSSERGDVRVRGIGHATDVFMMQDRKMINCFPATDLAAEKAFEKAKCSHSDIDVVETHDAFGILELINMEDLGFFKRGEGWKAFREGRTSLDGDFPVNPSGGLKARGHPVGATGLAQICEIYWQLTGNAGKRQVDKAKSGLCHNIGGFGNNVVVNILEKVN